MRHTGQLVQHCNLAVDHCPLMGVDQCRLMGVDKCPLMAVDQCPLMFGYDCVCYQVSIVCCFIRDVVFMQL